MGTLQSIRMQLFSRWTLCGLYKRQWEIFNASWKTLHQNLGCCILHFGLLGKRYSQIHIVKDLFMWEKKKLKIKYSLNNYNIKYSHKKNDALLYGFYNFCIDVCMYIGNIALLHKHKRYVI